MKNFKKVVDKKSWGDKIEKFAKRTERFKEGMSEEEAEEGWTLMTDEESKWKIEHWKENSWKR